jgi:DNA-binding response OmpR family regulator
MAKTRKSAEPEESVRAPRLQIFASDIGKDWSDAAQQLIKGREWAAYDRGIDTQVMRLRKKIEADPHQPRLIKTVRGAGYLFAVAVASR